MGNRPKQLNLSDSELTRLHEVLCMDEDDDKYDARVSRRAKVLLYVHLNLSYYSIIFETGASAATISNVKRRFFAGGLDHALYELPRSGAPKRISPQEEDAIILLASFPPPEGHACWTLRLLAEKAVENEFETRISHNQIGVILKKHNHQLN